MGDQDSKILPVLRIRVFFGQESKKISYDTSFFAMLTKRGFMISHQFSKIYFAQEKKQFF